MAISQGSEILNGEYLDRLTVAIDGIDSSAALQVLVDQAFGAIAPVKASIADQLAKVSPMLALITPPTSPNDAITWIGKFITAYLKPMVVPATTYPLQLALLAVKVAALTDAIERAQKRILNCHVTIPPL